MVYDPCIGQFDYVQEQVPTYDFIKAHPTQFGLSSSTLSELEQMHTSCGYDKFITEYMKFPPAGLQPTVKTAANCDIFTTANNAATAANSCFNIYFINQTCPTPVDPLSDEIFTVNGVKSNYFNRADVKTALHAPSTVTWTECSNQNVFVGRGGPEGEGDYSLDSIQKVLPQVIEATNRTLVINGDLDMIIITAGTLLSLQNMTWNGDLGFQTKPATDILIDGVSQGIQHTERGLLWAETYQSGYVNFGIAYEILLTLIFRHMGPEYSPKTSLRHLQWMRGTIDSL